MRTKDIRSDLSNILKGAERNLRTALDSATKAQYNQGMAWYQYAHEDCALRADHYKVGLPVFVGMVSALSPQMRWEWNILEAEKMLVDKNYKPGTYGFCVDKARAIRDGADPVVTLNGPKTTAFYHCIVHPDQSWRVTIDRHQIRLLFPDGSDRMRRAMLEGFYGILEEVHCKVADERKIYPHQAQAIGWCVQREKR